MINQSKAFAAISFGEVMMRLSPPGSDRITQGSQFVKHAGGSELNVISGLARLGLRTGLLSKLPDNGIGKYIRNQIRSYGVSDDYVLNDTADDARLGIYYYESGGYPRKPQVIYDRGNSSFVGIDYDEIPPDISSKAHLFHTSGISLALDKKVREVAIRLIQDFKAQGAAISFDVNYRARLWGEDEARKAVEEILPYIDVLFVSEETSRRMLGRSGTLEEIQRGYYETFGVGVVASTQRKIISPRCHTFGSLLYYAKEDNFFTEKPYENIEVTDRIGSGDAYVSGVLYALLGGKGHQQAVAYGNAMSALKNTVPGDLLTTDRHEIESIIADHHATGFVNEMSR